MGLMSGMMGNAGRIEPAAAHQEYGKLLGQGEQIHAAYQLVRDAFLFTNRRLILVDKQGLTGKKVEYLKLKGYRILETNYRCPVGEIDIIAREKSTLVFVEVKARRSSRFGSPKGAVTPAKQRKISMAALDYLKRFDLENSRARFDVVSIDTTTGRPDIEVVKNAFDLAYG